MKSIKAKIFIFFGHFLATNLNFLWTILINKFRLIKKIQ